jgi:hypothetical protein
MGFQRLDRAVVPSQGPSSRALECTEIVQDNSSFRKCIGPSSVLHRLLKWSNASKWTTSSDWLHLS